MIVKFDTCRIFVLCLVLFQTVVAYSSESSLVADVDIRGEIDDNIFLTSQPHDTVTGVKITPSLFGFIKEENWEASLGARLRVNKYSDHNLDGNDQYFNFSGRYIQQRDIFALSVNYDLDSNLDSTSTDFAITGVRVERKVQGITPTYTRLLSERSSLVFSYTFSDVDYLDAENTGFIAYTTEVGSASLMYDFTERDKLSLSLSVVDYASKNELVTYQLFTSRFSLDHKFSETLSADLSIGVSRRNSTNLITQTFDFFGQPIEVSQEIDFEDRGLVYNVGAVQLFERGQIEGRIGLDNVTNSTGGLDEVSRFSINYANKMSELWRYNVIGRYEKVESVSVGLGRTNRKLFSFESVAYYSVTRNWNVNASYRYIIRRFSSDTSDDRAPHSNRIYVGLTYNFPSLSTF